MKSPDPSLPPSPASTFWDSGEPWRWLILAAFAAGLLVVAWLALTQQGQHRDRAQDRQKEVEQTLEKGR